MYGGLQWVSVYSACWGAQTDFYRPALVLLLLCIGGWRWRCFWAFTGAAEVGGYTYGALVYEYSTAVWRRSPAALALRVVLQRQADPRIAVRSANASAMASGMANAAVNDSDCRPI